MPNNLQWTKSVSTLTASALFALSITASGQSLVKNINTLPNPTPSFPNDSAPTEMAHVGDRLYFAATTGHMGRELYWIDESGSQPQLLVNLAPGSASSNPADITELPSGNFLFTASSTGSASELYVSDGTSAGTTKLTVGNDASSLNALTMHQGEAYFFATDGGDIGRTVWRTDGTQLGTVEVFDVGQTGSYSIEAEGIASNGADLFFTSHQATAPGFSAPKEWWLYKVGGPNGARLLIEGLGNNSPGPSDLTALGSQVMWVASDDLTGKEIWVSDGTPGGSGVIELVPGVIGSEPDELTLLNGELYFCATTPSTGADIFKTDGTSAGTVRVTDGPGTVTYASSLTAANGQLFYVASSSSTGYELWTTTGVPFTETLYADFEPGQSSSSPRFMTAWQGGILCQATTDEFGTELHFSDGTPGNTFIVSNIAVVNTSSDPYGLVAFNGRIFFAAAGALGLELWSTSGTPSTTDIYADIAVVPTDLSGLPSDLTSLGDTFVFTVHEGLPGRTLWVSDGSLGGTTSLSEAVPYGIDTDDPIEFRGRAYFSVDDGVHGDEMWATDGTAAGTNMVIDLKPGVLSSDPHFLTVYNGELYFRANMFSTGTELYATDGSAEGTRLVADINPGLSNSTPASALEHKGQLYFSAVTANAGRELWRTDGTTAGTQRVIDLNPGSGDAFSTFYSASFGDHLYFAGTAGDNDTELWRTDGTAAGTSLVADINPTSSSFPGNFAVTDDRLAFVATAGSVNQLFGTDGTVVEQLTTSPLSANGNWPIASNGEKLITMMRGIGGSFELVGTDGTPAGTGVIKVIHGNGNEYVSFQAWRVTSGPELIFTGGNGAVGSELWITDGTGPGTATLVDLLPGSGDSSPGDLRRMGNAIYWSAYLPEIGFELFSLPVAAFGGWVAEPYGVGCPGSNGRAPTIDATGSAELCETLFVRVDDAAPNSIVSHYFSFDYELFNFAGCDFVLGTPVFLAMSPTDAQGASTLALPLPSSSAFAGLGFWIQSVVADAGGSLLGSASATPALEVILGQ